jgi:hypothetical protein
MTARKKKPVPKIGTGSPATLHLEVFGELLWDAFDAMPYHVGSSAMGKVWRDVDVRVILPDRRYRVLFGDPWKRGGHLRMAHSRWGVVCMAFSALGEKMTGLPIDFQVQSQTEANTYDGVRNAIGIAHPVEWRG